MAYMQSSRLVLDDFSFSSSGYLPAKIFLQTPKKKLRHKYINEFSLKQQSGSSSHSSSLVSYRTAGRSEQLQEDHIRVKQWLKLLCSPSAKVSASAGVTLKPTAAAWDGNTCPFCSHTPDIMSKQ